MNTPASSYVSSSSTEADLHSSSPPDTPKRAYKSHQAVRNTYGRAKPISTFDTPSSTDPWTTYSGNSSNMGCNGDSPLQRRTRLSGAFAELSTSSPSHTSHTRTGARSLMEKLERAKLDLHSDSDSDDKVNANGSGRGMRLRSLHMRKKSLDNDEDDGNIFLAADSKARTREHRPQDQARDRNGSVRDDHDETTKDQALTAQAQTPSKRKREVAVKVVVPAVGKSLRARGGADNEESLSQLSPRSLSSSSLSSWSSACSQSPPGSPGQRISSKRSRLTSASLDSSASSSQKPKQRSSVSISDTRDDAEAEKRPLQSQQQTTLSAFFMPKASKGTGILKARTGAHIPTTHSDATAVSTKSASSPSLKDPQPKKLEQLFLAFTKDRTKSAIPTSSSTPPKGPSSSRAAPRRLQREDEKLARYHCPQCKMPYVCGQPEDEQIHERYHRGVMGGIDYPVYKHEVVVATFSDFENESFGGGRGGRRSSGGGTGNARGEMGMAYSRIVMVSMSDAGRTTTSSSSPAASSGSGFEKRKVLEVLQVVNKELGSVDFDPEKLDSCKVFLYISSKKKAIGCLVAERIKQGFEILSSAETITTAPATPSGSSSSPSSTTTSTSTSTPISSDANDSGNNADTTTLTTLMTPSELKPRAGTDDGGSAVFCSIEPRPAICGINRIWVSEQNRRQKIASRLLDAVRERFIYACKLEHKDLAFSQPTGDGKALARQYLGTDKFLVYVE
ncbi:hypothetical protein BC939DRAFT_496653 [Gamsiella multidivaricata]|uniref:uncharacterized protein n=1 Tax=Gamsiella multidivaricata TaxID=101098 RepID=UPI0022205BF0|nr:uncharacterized protein BC939DRAFT_496653 [Gamsiella multidivaricata]KAI7817452.1 hypothetical protein BC939DRAFT_496653 [Gamsiella multidivaricata]